MSELPEGANKPNPMPCKAKEIVNPQMSVDSARIRRDRTPATRAKAITLRSLVRSTNHPAGKSVSRRASP